MGTCGSLDGVCTHQRGQTPARPAEGLQNQSLGRELETGTRHPLPSALCPGQAVEDPTAMQMAPKTLENVAQKPPAFVARLLLRFYFFPPLNSTPYFNLMWP